ncbi:hypothetical protein Ciccas_002634 [Cichlidogyrus casuarinus]|uniref:Uncharacterized protein n=1 Tax=Cichlidogyrus casuarinus TaxID=1844966 RepID=A0ABD2QGQ2_9PLAT
MKFLIALCACCTLVALAVGNQKVPSGDRNEPVTAGNGKGPSEIKNGPAIPMGVKPAPADKQKGPFGNRNGTGTGPAPAGNGKGPSQAKNEIEPNSMFDFCATDVSAENCLKNLQAVLTANKSDITTLVTCVKSAITKFEADIKTFLERTKVSVTPDQKFALSLAEFRSGLMKLGYDEVLLKLRLIDESFAKLKSQTDLTKSLIYRFVFPLVAKSSKIFSKTTEKYEKLNHIFKEAYAILNTSSEPVITKPAECQVPATIWVRNQKHH